MFVCQEAITLNCYLLLKHWHKHSKSNSPFANCRNVSATILKAFNAILNWTGSEWIRLLSMNQMWIAKMINNNNKRKREEENRRINCEKSENLL